MCVCVNFTNGKPAYFDVSIWNTMQPSYIIPSSTLAVAAAFAGEGEKDAHHQADVEPAGQGCRCYGDGATCGPSQQKCGPRSKATANN